MEPLYLKEMQKIKYGTLVLENGVAVVKDEETVDLNSIKSDDPIAYSYGARDARLGRKLPHHRSKAYKELASEYLRGYGDYKK